MAKIMTYMEAIELTIAEEMRRDPTIFTYGWGGPPYGVGMYSGKAKEFFEEFGSERICFSGINETQEAGAGIGAALAGTRPIVNLWHTDFAIDAWGQIVLQAATIRFKLAYKADCPVVFRMSIAGYDDPGSLHHKGCFHNMLANARCIFVAIPSTPTDARGLWRTALRDAKDPMCMLEQRGLAIEEPVPDGDYTIPFGVADVKREGADVTIAAVGYWVMVALEAAEDLAKEGIDVEVWDPRCLTPFDRESLIKSVKKTGAMVVVDQAPKSFGTTGEFFATVGEALTPIPPMARVASMDAPVGWNRSLEFYVLPSKDKIIDAVKGVLERKG